MIQGYRLARMSEGVRRELPAVLSLVCFSLVVFSRVVVFRTHTILASHDNSEQWYAWFTVAARWFQRGTFLLWDPYVSGGRSFIGEPQAGLFYPINWLLFLAPFRDGHLNPWYLEWLVVFHFVIASLMQYALARHWRLSRSASVVAAVVFSYSGWMISTAFGYLGQFHSAIWLPAVVLFFLRAIEANTWRSRLRSIALCSICWALSFLAGAISPPFQIGLILAGLTVWLAWKREGTWKTTVGCFGLTVTIFLALSAVQFLPSLEYSRTAIRWIGTDTPVDFMSPISYQQIRTLSPLSPTALLGFIYPPFAYSSRSTYYVSLIVLPWMLWAALLGRAPICRFLSCALLLSCLYALGGWSPVTWLGYHLVPFIDKIRETERFMYTANWAMAGLAGFGIDELRRRWELSSRIPPILISCSACLFLILLFFGPTFSIAPSKVVTAITFLGLSTATILLPRFRPNVRNVCIVFFIAFDLAFYLWPALPAINSYDGVSNRWPGKHFRSTGAIRQIQDDRRLCRTDGTAAVPRNFGDVFSLLGLQSFSNTAPAKSFRVLHMATPGRSDQLFNVGSRIEVSGDSMKASFIPNFGHAVLFDEVEFSQSEEAVYQRLSESAFDVNSKLLLTPSEWERLPSAFRSAFSGSVEKLVGRSAQIVSYEPHVIRLTADANRPALLWLSEAYDPGWTVSVDGKAAILLNGDYCFRTVPLLSGHHEVTLQYRPRSVLAGGIITLCSLGLLVLAFGLSRRS